MRRTPDRPRENECRQRALRAGGAIDGAAGADPEVGARGRSAGLHVSAYTAREHLTAVFARFGVSLRGELIAAVLAPKGR